MVFIKNTRHKRPIANEAPTFHRGMRRAHNAMARQVGEKVKIPLIYFLSEAGGSSMLAY